MKEFGKRLKKLRREKELKQSDLADLLTVTPLTVIRWEAGLYEPRLSDLLKLSQYRPPRYIPMA